MSQNYAEVFPGNFEGESASGGTVPIESFGFITVELSNGDQSLNLASGAEATISIPISDQLKANAPAQIPLWYFDEALGRWIEEGSANNENGIYVGTVTHFSAWNVDMEMNVANLSGRVVDQHGNIIPGAKVYSKGVNYGGSSNATTNSNGMYSVPVKSNATSKLQAKLISTSGLEIVSSQSVTVQSGSSGGTTNVVDLVIDLSVTGNSFNLYGVNCDLNTYWAVGEKGNIYYYDTLWFKVETAYSEDLYDIDCPAYDSYWAVGANGMVLNSRDQGQTWNQVNVNTSNDLFAVEFMNGFYGWIIGEGGVIFKTEDAGQNWNPISLNITENLNDIQFLNKQNGWICGDNGLIISSLDGGLTWTTQTSGTNLNLEGLEFIDLNKGWTVGDQGLILQTTNSGQNWTIQNSGSTQNFKDIAFVPSIGGAICGENGTLLKSTNNGVDWMVENLSQNNDLNAVDLGLKFNTHSGGFAVGNDFNQDISLGIISYSVGWHLQNSGVSEVLQDVKAISANAAWAVGNSGSVIRTNDGGNTWLPVTTINTLGYDLYAVEVVGNNIWVSGENKMWKSTDDGLTWVELISDYSQVVKDIQFIDSNNGWYLWYKQNNFNERELFKTTDGGLTWVQVKNTPGGRSSFFPGFTLIDANRISVLDYDQLTKSYRVYHSTDGGNSWTSNNLQYTTREESGAWQAAIDHADDGIYVVSQSWYHQTDDFLNWFALQSNARYVSFLQMVNAQTGWLIDTGIVYKTSDGGQSWITQGGISFYIFGASKIDMVDSNTGWIVTGAGEIYKTTTGGD
jgi:photosystem II stability/assembly factor-like uncharacterized protein